MNGFYGTYYKKTPKVLILGVFCWEKVTTAVIQAVGGWSTEKMMLHYIKKTNKEQAQELKQYWETQN